MKALVEAFFSSNPGLELWALGSGLHRDALDLTPFGRAASFHAAESSPALVRAYYSFNRNAFQGDLSLPGWVLTDLYMLPGVVGLLVAPTDDLSPRWPLEKLDNGKSIVAAYFAAPSLTEGLFVGASLISAVPGRRGGPMIKALTLKMYRAARLRGVTMWEERAVRTHAQVGPLQIVSGTPGPHERAERNFVYETELGDDAVMRAALSGEVTAEPSDRFAIDDLAGFHDLRSRAEAGERIVIVPPGIDEDGRVCLTIG